jgi:hypothetical protein
LVALDTPASPKIEPTLWDLDHIPGLCEDSSTDEKLKVFLSEDLIRICARKGRFISVEGTRSLTVLSSCVFTSLRDSSNLDKKLSLTQSALDSDVISIHDFREALVAITQQVDEELQRYLAGERANYAESVSPIYSNDDQDSGTVAGSNIESIFDWLPESETDLGTNAPSSFSEHKDFDRIVDIDPDSREDCSPHDAQLVELTGTTTEPEHSSLRPLSFYENSDRSLLGIILQHALPHDTECNEFASESVESITPAESPFSFHCASSYVDNFVPELFELVLEVAESSLSSETASPHPGFGFEVPDDVHSIDGESKSSSKSSFTLAQPPIEAEHLNITSKSAQLLHSPWIRSALSKSMSVTTQN